MLQPGPSMKSETVALEGKSANGCNCWLVNCC